MWKALATVLAFIERKGFGDKPVAIAVKQSWPTLTADASRAFWQVPPDERCVVRPPHQWLANHVVGGSASDLWLVKRWFYGRTPIA